LNYRKEIDGLRALAIAPVVLFHAGVGGFSGGFTGVDVFFVISGYLITALIAGEIETGSFDAARFYERRARRILPALFPVLGATFALTWMLYTPDDFRQFSAALGGTAGFASNLVFAWKGNYFYSDEGLLPLLHTWSLSVEEQFYFVFPVILILMMKRWPRAVLPAVLIIMGVSFAGAWLGSLHAQKLAFYSLPTRMWELMAGAACALLPRPPRPRVLPALAGLVLIIAGVFLIDDTTPAPGPMFLLPVVGTALVLLFASTANLAGRILGWRPFVLLGMVSYGTYLWHQPIIAIGQYLWFGDLPVAAQVAAIAGSVLLGVLSFLLVERPVRGRRLLATRRALFVFCGAALALFGVLGVAGYVTLLKPHSAAEAERLGAVLSSAPFGESYMPGGSALPYVLYGDSHAQQYFPAVLARFGPGALLTASGCMSLPGITNRAGPGDPGAGKCEPLAGDLVALVRTRQVRTVIWAQRWDRFLYDTSTDRTLGQVSLEGRAAFIAGMERMLAALGPQVEVILVGNSPTAWAAGDEMAGGYLRCEAFLNVACPRSYPQSRAEGREASRILQSLAADHPNVRYVDAAAALCRDGRCPIVEGNVLYYKDGSHTTPPAARMVVERIPPLVPPAKAAAPLASPGRSP